MLHGHMLHFVAAVLVIIVSTGLQSLVTVLIYPLTQVAIGGEIKVRHLERLNNYVFGSNDFSIVLLEICFVFTLATALKYVHVLVARLLGLRIRQSLAGRVFEKYVTGQLVFHAGQKQGVLINNLVNETERVDNAIVFIVHYLNEIFMALALTVIMISFSWKISTVILIFGMIIYFSIRKIAFEYSGRTGRERVQIFQQVNSLSAEAFNGIKQIKIFDYEAPLLRRMYRLLDSYVKLMIKFIALRRLPSPLIQISAALIVIICVLVNMKFNLVNLIEVMPLFATLSYVASRLFLNLTELLTSHMNIISYGPSIDVVSGILHAHEIDNIVTTTDEKETGEIVKTIRYSVEFKNACFSFSPEKTALDNINLKIIAGSKVGIVGYSGSGKSTFVNVLAGLYPLTSGEILVDGKNLGNILKSSYRKRLGIVSQDVFVFYGTVAENIRIGFTEASDEQVFAAAKMANAHGFIDKLPMKYETIIGERGANLSGGECQRIAIARALVRNPDLLIFDEATSSLDKEAEKYISDTIDMLGKDRTVVLVSHNLNLITNCDMIYLFDKGRIIASGTHDELLRRSVVYCSLFEICVAGGKHDN